MRPGRCRSLAFYRAKNPRCESRGADHPNHTLSGRVALDPRRRAFSVRSVFDRLCRSSTRSASSLTRQDASTASFGDGFESVSFEANKPFSTDKFQRFLEQLPNSVFRAKGVLWIDEGYRRYIFHLVGKRFTLDETGLSSPMRNRLALIGQNLDHKALHDQLEGCLCDIGGGA